MTTTRTDPLEEFDTLTSEIEGLKKQFQEGKVQPAEYDVLSKQLKDRMISAETQAYKLARKDESLARRLRGRAYKEQLTQKILVYMMRTNDKALEPEFDLDRFPKYQIGDDRGEKAYVELPTLERLENIGILGGTLFERLLYCPKCKRPTDVYLRFRCPQCTSIEITINHMMEHLQCGTIHQESAFLAGKNIICPSCKKLLQSGQEYRLIGIVCACNQCKAHFEDPSQGFYCRKCGVDFTLLNGTVIDVYSYKITETAFKEAQQFLGVNTISAILQESGLQVKVPGVLVAAEKQIIFGLIVEREGKTIAIDIVQRPEEVEIEAVLEMYVKVLEAAPTIAILGATPRVSKRARDVASLHKIVLAEGPTLSDVGTKILEITRSA